MTFVATGDHDDAVVGRPVEVSAADAEPSVEVEWERFRVEATEDIAAARDAAERGAHAEAAAILNRRQEALARSSARLAGDVGCVALVSELRELSARVADRREYGQTGRACLLAGMSSHTQQRATSVQLFTSAGAAPQSSTFSTTGTGFGAYATPMMVNMVASSRKTREDGGGSGSLFDPK